MECSALIPRLIAAHPSGRLRSIKRVFFLDSWASDTAKLQARVVTPEPPLALRNTSNLPSAFFGGRDAERRAEARARASAMAPGSKGRVRNSRAPARMDMSNRSESTCAEETIT